MGVVNVAVRAKISIRNVETNFEVSKAALVNMGYEVEEPRDTIA